VAWIWELRPIPRLFQCSPFRNILVTLSGHARVSSASAAMSYLFPIDAQGLNNRPKWRIDSVLVWAGLADAAQAYSADYPEHREYSGGGDSITWQQGILGILRHAFYMI